MVPLLCWATGLRTWLPWAVGLLLCLPPGLGRGEEPVASPRTLFLAPLLPTGAEAANRQASLLDVVARMRESRSQTRREPVVEEIAPPDHLGLAYELYRVAPDGVAKAVDPLHHIFHTGELFFVRWMANLPGMVEAFSLDPREGRQQLLAPRFLEAGQALRLPEQGAFRFFGTGASEILQWRHRPCVQGLAALPDDAFRKSNNFGGILPLCHTPPPEPALDVTAQQSEGIAVVALSPISRQEHRRLAGRLFTLLLRHNPLGRDPDFADWLIAPGEVSPHNTAALPLPRVRGHDGRPRIRVVSPKGERLTMPIAIDVRFEAEEGAAIDPASLKVIYLSLFELDISDRVQPYITSQGLLMEDAKLPTGDHTIEISIADNQGRQTRERLRFSIQ